ncbi:MAG: hypothetical protein QXR19_09945 [Candidatus Jordarchaeaceae archaeon]
MHPLDKRQQEIIEEFRAKYTSVPSRINSFRDTHRELIDEGKKSIQLPVSLREHSEEIIATYYICFIDELIGFQIEKFVEDLETTTKALGLQNGMETMSLLTLTTENLRAASKIPSDVVKNLVDIRGGDISDEVTKAILVKENIEPYFQEMVLNLGSFSSNVDLRWPVAQIRYAFDHFLRSHGVAKPEKNISQIYREIYTSYPLSEGKDIYWDILYFQLLSPIYDDLVSIASPMIEEKLSSLEIERKAAPILLKAQQAAEKTKASLEMLNSKLETIMYHVFHRGLELSPEYEAEIENAMDRVLRRITLEKHGVQDIRNPEEMMDIALERIKRLMKEYELLILPLLEPEDIKPYVEDKKGFLEKNSDLLDRRLRMKLKRYTSPKITPQNLAKGFTEYLKQSLKAKERHSIF